MQRYTGQHPVAEPQALAEADHIFRYSIASYAFDAEMLLRRSWTDFFNSWVPWRAASPLDK